MLTNYMKGIVSESFCDKADYAKALQNFCLRCLECGIPFKVVQDSLDSVNEWIKLEYGSAHLVTVEI